MTNPFKKALKAETLSSDIKPGEAVPKNEAPLTMATIDKVEDFYIASRNKLIIGCFDYADNPTQAKSLLEQTFKRLKRDAKIAEKIIEQKDNVINVFDDLVQVQTQNKGDKNLSHKKKRIVQGLFCKDFIPKKSSIKRKFVKEEDDDMPEKCQKLSLEEQVASTNALDIIFNN